MTANAQQKVTIALQTAEDAKKAAKRQTENFIVEQEAQIEAWKKAERKRLLGRRERAAFGHLRAEVSHVASKLKIAICIRHSI